MLTVKILCFKVNNRKNFKHRKGGNVFKEYLENQQHYVEIDGFKSQLLRVHSGVPQSSVLGPLLFLIYVNDILTVCSFSSVFMFADDTKLVSSIKSTVQSAEMQKDLDNLFAWCKKWK